MTPNSLRHMPGQIGARADDGSQRVVALLNEVAAIIIPDTAEPGASPERMLKETVFRMRARQMLTAHLISSLESFDPPNRPAGEP